MIPGDSRDILTRPSSSGVESHRVTHELPAGADTHAMKKI